MNTGKILICLKKKDKIGVGAQPWPNSGSTNIREELKKSIVLVLSLGLNLAELTLGKA